MENVKKCDENEEEKNVMKMNIKQVEALKDEILAERSLDECMKDLKEKQFK